MEDYIYLDKMFFLSRLMYKIKNYFIFMTLNQIYQGKHSRL